VALLNFTGFYEKNTFSGAFSTIEKEQRLMVKNKNFTILPALLMVIYIVAMFYMPPERKLTHFHEEIKAVLPSIEMKINSEKCIPTIKGEPFLIKPQGISLYYLFFIDTLNIKPTIKNLYILDQVPNLLFIILLLLILTAEFGFSGAMKMTLLYICTSEVIRRFSVIYPDNFFIPLVFLNIAVIYIFLKRGKPRLLLYISYSLCALAFLFKGLPAIPFHVISLVAGYVLFRQWRRLFSVHHLLAILLSVLIAFSPFIVTGNIERIPELLVTLRSITLFHFNEYYAPFSFWQHLFYFPFATVVMFFPFTVLITLFVFRRTYRIINDNSIAKYSVIVFVLNYAVYYFSSKPQVQYISSLIPFLIICLYVIYTKSSTGKKQFADIILAATAFIIIALMLFLSFKPDLVPQVFIHQKWTFIIIVMLVSIVLALLYIRLEQLRIVIICSVFIFAGFFFLRLPTAKTQQSYKWVARQEAQAKKLCSMAKGNKIYTYNMKTYWNEDLLYYLTLENNQINFEKYYQGDKPKYILINKDQISHLCPDTSQCRIVAEEEIFYYDLKEVAGGPDSPLRKGKCLLIVL